ncbi:hypothetical protein BRARA_D02587 [Brassica rapa]|uniref:Uncharacterized protein n=1 Tax=Brassica campestris TaxID=3711 RepID=A0A397ZVR5_BRACM|nr:hypothetical protein BRARA_D02587 [Brassica rapa]
MQPRYPTIFPLTSLTIKGGLWVLTCYSLAMLLSRIENQDLGDERKEAAD